MRKNLKDFAGRDQVFIDANIFLHHAFNVNDVSVQFLGRVEAQDIRAATSALVLEEVFFKLLMQSASNLLRKVTVEKVAFALKDKTKRSEIVRPLVHYWKYIGRLRESGMTIIDLKGADIAAAMEVTNSLGLITADAAHLSVMKRKDIHHIATADHDFTALADVSIWSPMVK
jgi:predicted nucleic acid-binding protein